LISLGIGIGLGLLVTWVLVPLDFKNADPAALRSALKEEYVRMISLAYEADGDVALAQRRIAALQLANPAQTFTDLIERERRSANETTRQDALIHLGHALGYALPYTTLRPTPLPRHSAVITVTVVATPMPRVPSFKLVEHKQLSCADEPENARLRFYVRDAAGRDVPNIAIEIRGKDIIETVYTGLKPEHGLGYADYQAAPGTYAVTILNSHAETISNLVIGAKPVNCQADRGMTPRGWKLVFQQQEYR
jgi:hypothetical protein